MKRMRFRKRDGAAPALAGPITAFEALKLQLILRRSQGRHYIRVEHRAVGNLCAAQLKTKMAGQKEELGRGRHQTQL